MNPSAVAQWIVLALAMMLAIRRATTGRLAERLATLASPSAASAGTQSVRAPPRGRGLGLVRARRRRRADRFAAASLPEAIDLVRMAVGSGLAPAGALTEIVAHGPAAVASRLQPVLDLAGSGLSFGEACHRVALLDGVVAPLVTLLGEGANTGAGLHDALERLADDRANDQRRAAEERARAVPVKLLFPLVCCTLPGFVLLAVVPAVLRAFDQ